MKRNMDLIRDLLLKIEEAPEAIDLEQILSDEDETKWNEAAYHVRMLVQEVGFVRGIDGGSNSGENWLDLTLTWSGHDFLNDVRDPAIWRKTKEGVEKIGGAGWEIIVGMAKAYVKAKAKEKLGIDL